jgi:dedicated sortase system histidine kinase
VSLRLQLAAFVVLTFFLPWAGIRLVESIEATLRSGLETLLTRDAEAVAVQVVASEAFNRRLSPPQGFSRPLYVNPLSRPPRLDASRRDWQFSREADTSRAVMLEDGSRISLGLHQGFLYLFCDVVDDDVVYRGESGQPPYGDRIVLAFGRDPAAPEYLLLASSGDGPFSAQPSSGGEQFIPSGGDEDLVRGSWRSGGGGYLVEARVPSRILSGTLGIAIIDSDIGGADARLAASSWNASGAPNALVSESPELEAILGTRAGGNQRFRIFDSDGWVLADAGTLEPAPSIDPAASPSLVERLFRRILRRDDPEYLGRLEIEPGRIGDPALLSVLDGEPRVAWYRRGADVSAIVAAAVPVDPDNPGRGGVLIEQASDPILSLANQAMLRVVTTTVVVTLVAALALLGYASLLSFRIGRLARAAESALGPRGEITARLPGAKASDEIGDLSRSFQDLLKRLRDYTRYLQSLTSKLSHELRTPLAIVATSADNLEHETGSEAGRSYLKRLRQGADRLESILQAMTAATRVEQAIAQAEIEEFDIGEVIASCVSAYRDVYEAERFTLELPPRPIIVAGSAELIAQLLDKLIDNAVSFAEGSTDIAVSLVRDKGEVLLDVVNRGPLLPEAMRHQLFDSLVSVREAGGDKPHLGLGLYIVTLVAEFHGGRVEADNLADSSGVRMRVVLPCRDAGSA